MIPYRISCATVQKICLRDSYPLVLALNSPRSFLFISYLRWWWSVWMSVSPHNSCVETVMPKVMVWWWWGGALGRDSGHEDPSNGISALTRCEIWTWKVLTWPGWHLDRGLPISRTGKRKFLCFVSCLVHGISLQQSKQTRTGTNVRTEIRSQNTLDQVKNWIRSMKYLTSTGRSMLAPISYSDLQLSYKGVDVQG